MSLGQHLQQQRELQDISVNKAAKMIGYDRSVIERCESAASSQTVKRLIQYSSLLNTNLSNQLASVPRTLTHARILVIDNNEDRWNFYRSTFNLYFKKSHLICMHSVDEAYEHMRRNRLNLIIIYQNKHNNAAELATKQAKCKQSRNACLLIVSKEHNNEIKQLAKDLNQTFFCMRRSKEALARLLEDMLRYG
jgi:hypothetical protein